MLALRLHDRHDLRLAEEPAPVAGPGEELVRVTAVGICGSDLHWFEDGSMGPDRLAHPLVLGHEAAGIVASGSRAGRRVAIEPAIACGRCDPCRRGRPHVCEDLRFAGTVGQDGTLRGLLAWPADCLIDVPAGLDDTDTLMLEPLGIALHAMDLARLPVGGSVGVFGCGPIGLLLIRLARLAGARTIVATDLHAHRLEAAIRSGATAVARVDGGAERDMLARHEPHGLDATFEAAGEDDALETAMHLARPTSRVVIIGIPGTDRTSFPAGLARRKGLSLLLSRRMNRTYPRAIELVGSGRLEVRSLVSDRFPLADAVEAFDTASRRAGLKVVVDLA